MEEIKKIIKEYKDLFLICPIIVAPAALGNTFFIGKSVGLHIPGLWEVFITVTLGLFFFIVLVKKRKKPIVASAVFSLIIMVWGYLCYYIILVGFSAFLGSGTLRPIVRSA